VITFGSLFAGIGGIDLGLERAGMRCAWQVEIDDYATRVLAKHWPDVPRFRDVRSVGLHNLPAVDLICGGFPCQDISDGGPKSGMDGQRSGPMWREFARIVRELRPRYVLVENVAALLGRGISTVFGDLAALGFDIEWHCLPAAALGAPHRRDRIFVMAYPKGIGCTRERAAQALQNKRALELTRRRGGPAGEWAIEPGMGRVAYGVSSRVERLIRLGSAVLPQVAEFVGRQIVAFDER
jgi:DNA (cytosine-5)-methyltransferase 1